MKTCAQCSAQFASTPEDQKLYAVLKILEPIYCPDCRHQHRCAYRNERTLYKRKCNLCGGSVVTVFSGNEQFPVYCSECWWGDKCDPLSFGKEFDFDRPFFDQFRELQDVVPRLSLNNPKHENSEYCNQCVGNKNSYLLFAADDNEDCMYSYWINRCKDTYNSSNLAECQLCFDVTDSESCYQCVYSQDLKNSTDCYFCYDLIGCQNCFGCAGLRNKKYHIFNKPHTKEEYEKKFKSFEIGSFKNYKKFVKEFLKIRLTIPHKYVHIINSENSIGDYIINSKNCHHAFDVFDSEDSRYAFNLVHQHFRNIDVSYSTEAHNVYQSMSAIGRDLYFSTFPWYSSDVWYSDLIFQSHHIFGCVGLRNQKYCILNKQYKPDEYKSLKAKIIEHMRRPVPGGTGETEYGQFFPVKNSIYAYNETVAQDYFPMTKEQVLEKGWRWKDEDKSEFQTATVELPDTVSDAPKDIIKEVLACKDCGRNYRILELELASHQKMKLPLPHQCPECRYRHRMDLRNPRKLWQRECQKCSAKIHSTYSPERPETVYCEPCYQKSFA